MTTEYLWSSDISISSQSTPKMLMKKQASDLGVITKNIVEADVTTTIYNDGIETMYSHCFVLIAPLLNYERITLFCIDQPLISEYPLKINSEFYTNEDCSCDNIDKFNGCLKQILSSKEVADLINSLIAQSS
jgi:hypothetical protein